MVLGAGSIVALVGGNSRTPREVLTVTSHSPPQLTSEDVDKHMSYRQ